MNQCIRLVDTFVSLAFSRPVDEVKVASVGFVSILGNLRSVNKLCKNKKFLRTK